MNVRITWIAVALGACLTGCYGTSTPTDDPMDDGRVPLDRTLPTSVHEHSLRGRVVSFLDDEPVPEVRVCLLDLPAPACVTSDEWGWVEIGPLPRRTRARIELTHPDFVRQLQLWEVTNIDRYDLLFRMVSPEMVALVAAERGVTLDLSRGIVAGHITSHNHRDAGLEGATLTLDTEADGPIQISPTFPFSSSSPTTTSGFFAFANVEPGQHVLETSAAGRACIEGLRWARGPDAFDVPVEPNTMTTMYIICPETTVAAPDDSCFDGGRGRYATCAGSAPGCMVVEPGTSAVCVEDVGPCPDEMNTCVGDLLVRGCSNLQPIGVDCFALGGRCDAEADACVDVRVGDACGGDAVCEDGSQCNVVSGADDLTPDWEQLGVCEEGLDCAGYFACNLDCSDTDCVQDCYERVLDYARPTVDRTYGCFAEADCAPSLTSCQEACPTEWTVCVGG